MKLNEIDLFGRQTPAFNQIMAKHKMAYVDLVIQLSKGIKIELEHTPDIAVAREIALDHLNELPDYYTRLDKMENK